MGFADSKQDIPLHSKCPCTSAEGDRRRAKRRNHPELAFPWQGPGGGAGHDWLKQPILVVRDRVIEQWMASIRELYNPRAAHLLPLDGISHRTLAAAMRPPIWVCLITFKQL